MEHQGAEGEKRVSGVSQAGLVLTDGQAATVVDHARAEEPSEACGLLGGREGRVEVVYPLPNAERSPVRYLAEPEAQVDAMMEIESKGLEVVGIYHSHPESGAYPSPTDMAMAAYPDAVYVIVSLAEGPDPVLRGFRIQDGESQEVALVVSEEKRAPAAEGLHV